MSTNKSDGFNQFSHLELFDPWLLSCNFQSGLKSRTNYKSDFG